MNKLSLAAATALLAAATPLRGQQFGAYSASHDGQLFISEPVQATDPATVYLFHRAAGGWIQDGTMMAPAHEGGDYFGRFVAVDDRSLLIGGTTMDSSSGAVWAYRRHGDGWEPVAMLRPDDVAEGDSFGRFGLLHGDLLFVTALGHDDGRGAVWVFQRGAGGEWIQEARLSPGGEAPEREFFGWSLAFDGQRLLTGALQASPELQNRGAAYVFRRNGPGDWIQEAKLSLDEDEANPGDTFGFTVGWLDGRALIGVPGRDHGVGEIRAYRYQDGEWEPDLALSAYDRVPGNRFGSSLAFDDGELWVGAPGAQGSGRVYRISYDAVTHEFGAMTKLAGPRGEVGDSFGGTITLTHGLAVVGSPNDDFGLGSAVVLERNGDDWVATGTLTGPDPTSLDPIIGGDVACADGKADRYACSQVDVLSFLPVTDIGGGRGARTNDVWGWTDPRTGHEYALVGRTDGTAFVDVTDPGRPVYVGNLPKTPGSRGNAWRDIKVYQDHAYIVADGAGRHGMQVFDLNRLRDVNHTPTTFQPDALYDRIASAHNIVINEATGYAYAVGANSGGETCGGGLHMIDLTSPDRPTFQGCFADTTTGNAGTGYSHDAMCIIYHGPDTDYDGREICFGANENKLSIADLTDKDHPVAISSAGYPNVGYVHQGWITEDHKYFFTNDEGDETASVQAGEPMPGTRTLIWDVQDLDDPIMVKEHFGETFTIDHNLYIRGSLMYQSNYVSGLRVLDISEPENPREVGFFDTVPESEAVVFDGSWSNYPFFESGTIVVSSGAEGVFFLKYRPVDLVP